MINLRYHIVSITAVFLALGIGITMGSTFLGRTALDQIDTNVDRARRERDDTRVENAQLRRAVATFEERGRGLTEQGAKSIFQGRLERVPVLVIAAPGVDRTSLDNLRIALRSAGAGFDGTLVMSDKLALSGDDADELANVIDLPTADPVQLRAGLVSRVSSELVDAAEPQPDVPPTTRTTVSTDPPAGATTSTSSTTVVTIPGPDSVTSAPTITSLVEAGFFDFQPSDDGRPIDALLPQRGYRYVIVTGPTLEPSDADVVLPLLRAMTEDGPAPVVVASAAVGDDPEAVRGKALEPLMKDKGLADRVSTVNHMEEFSGIAAVVLAIEDLEVRGVGHYGYGGTTESVLPTDEGS